MKKGNTYMAFLLYVGAVYELQDGGTSIMVSLAFVILVLLL